MRESERLWLIGLMFFAIFSLNLRGDPRHDGFAAVPIAVAITHDGSIRLDRFADVDGFSEHYSIVEQSGDLVGYFPWLIGVTAVPAVVMVDVLDVVGIGPGSDQAVREMARWFAFMQNVTAALTSALATMAIFVLVRERRSDAGRRHALLAAFAFACGTSVWSSAAATIWQHGPSIAAVSWGLVMVMRLQRSESSTDPGDRISRVTRHRELQAGALLMLAVAFRPTNAIAFFGCGLLLLMTTRRSPTTYVLGACIVAIPWIAVTEHVYGSFLQPYGSASRIRWHPEVGEALLANLTSPGRGLFIFTPIAAVSILGGIKAFRLDARDPVMWTAFGIITSHWIVISLFPHWTGGKSFGPRLFTDVLPFFVLLSVSLGTAESLTRDSMRKPRSIAFFLALLVSVTIHAGGALVLSSGCWSTVPVDLDKNSWRVWSWSDPLFARGYRDLVHDPIAAIRGVCKEFSW